MPAQYKFNHIFELDGADVTAQVWFTYCQADGVVFHDVTIARVEFMDDAPSRSDGYFYPVIRNLAEAYLYSVEGNRDALDAVREAE